jgi:hypothetical protein
MVLVSALLPSKALGHEGKAVLPSEQPDGDLRLEAALLEEPRLAEPVALISPEIQGAGVVVTFAKKGYRTFTKLAAVSALASANGRLGM